ncbi:LysR substrate-binding domain-containing protein [Salinisphaera sp. Q1T1-3]|uniref:LysR substrate-binding domain-containing protein n=1 Tax=Salinisphaera sp. Q1T1-3 TaxID=2321229 RepID=UPI001314B694|nr:LysR substrate-binding domain-containing protein [Salinisphaera sp. Q1T1-3]
MELRHLRYFVTLAEELHFARAAERLHIVQPALSMQIKSLETEFGTPLFERSRRCVRLTPAGEALLPEARRCLQQARQAQQAVANTVAGAAGHIRIGYSASALYSGLLRDCLTIVMAERPGIRLSFNEIHPRSLRDALTERQVDVVLSTTLSLPDAPGVMRHTLCEFPIRAALPSRHPLTAHDTIPFARLIDQTMIGYAGPHDAAGAMLYRRVLGVEPHIAYRADNPVTVLGLVETGVGLALVSAALAARFRGDVVFRPIAGLNARMDISLTHRCEEADPAVRFFIDTALALPPPNATD